MNTVVNKNGRLEGHNTDFGGFLYMVKAHHVSLKGKRVLILGTGGTHKPVTAVCKAEGAAEIITVSRNPKGEEISYQQAAKRQDIQIIVNTTPVGMYPNNANVWWKWNGFPIVKRSLTPSIIPSVRSFCCVQKKPEYWQ